MARRLVKLDMSRILRTKALAWDWLMKEAVEQGMEKELKQLLDSAYSQTSPSKGYK